MNAVWFLFQILRRFPLLLLCLLLVRCAVKHQPQTFDPAFRLRAPQYTADRLWERRALEKEPNRGPLQQRRLLNLYRQELTELHVDHPLREKLVEEVNYLEAELAPVLSEIETLKARNQESRRRGRSQGDSDRIQIETDGMRDLYAEARQLWNDDANTEALAVLDRIVSSEEFRDDASDDEWFQVHYIRFRVALDVGDFGRQKQSYVQMRKLESCHEKTATAGFLLSLNTFVQNDAKGAAQTLAEQCDPDDSLSHQLRKMYWMGRFTEDPGNPGASYGKLLSFPLPGYYQYLALTRSQQKIVFSDSMFEGRSFLKEPLEVSSRISRWWRAAESRLKEDLPKDAAVYLRAAFYSLKDSVGTRNDAAALLYTAHLLQAAGDQLPALQIYGIVAEAYYEGELTQEEYPVDFLAEMFPRPFGAPITALTAQWNVDQDLVYSLMRQESAFNPRAVSVAGARGLLQMMPFLAEHLAAQWGDGDYSPSLLFDGEENLKWAVFHLHQLGGAAPHLALIAGSYNAGIARVGGWWRRFGHLPLDVFVELIPVAETRRYIQLVMRNYLYYRGGRSQRVVRGGWVPFTLPPFQGTSPGIGD